MKIQRSSAQTDFTEMRNGNVNEETVDEMENYNILIAVLKNSKWFSKQCL
jgi:hypothetical protein